MVVKTAHSRHQIMTKIVHRRSDTGRFTTEKYADKHPKTTEREVSFATFIAVSSLATRGISSCSRLICRLGVLTQLPTQLRTSDLTRFGTTT